MGAGRNSETISLFPPKSRHQSEGRQFACSAPRPFFTGVFYEKREALLEHLKTYLKQGISPREAVLRVAREMQDAAQAAIAQGHTETMDFARLSPMTMELKAQKAATDLDKNGRKKRRDSTGFALSDRPFASDGARQMRDAIKYELKE